MEIIYFELNNWFCGRDYPNSEPFIGWMGRDLGIPFDNEDWVKENKLVVVHSFVDMSQNYCVTATKEWVENNCPELLTKYKEFIRYKKDGELPKGRFGSPFLEYKEENIGIYFADECVDNNGFLYYEIEEDADVDEPKISNDKLAELIQNATETDLFSDLSKGYKIYAMAKGKIIATFYNLKYRFYNLRRN